MNTRKSYLLDLTKYQWRWLPVFFAVCVISLSCTHAIAGISGGYVASDTSGLLYLRLTQTGQTLNGYMEIISAQNDTANGFSIRKVDNLTGSINGSVISLRIKDLFGLSNALMDGSVHGSRLTFEMPSSDGGLTQTIYAATSSEHWNQQVRAFEAKRRRFAFKLLWYSNIASLANSVQSSYESAARNKAASEAKRPDDNAKLDEAKAKQQRITEQLNKAQSVLDAAKQIAADKDAKYKKTQNSDDEYEASSAKYDVSSAEYDVSSTQSDLANANDDVTSAEKEVLEDEETIPVSSGQIESDAFEWHLLQSLLRKPVGALTISPIKVSSPRFVLSRPSRYSKRLGTVSAGAAVNCISCSAGWSLVPFSDNTIGWLTPKSVSASLLSSDLLGNSLVHSAGKYVKTSLGQSASDDGAGFIHIVFGSIGIDMPKSAEEQAAVGYDVPKNDWSQWIPGDRMYFACQHPAIDHTGMYIGNGDFIHASMGNSQQVVIDHVDDSYYGNHLVCVRRSHELVEVEPLSVSHAHTSLSKMSNIKL